jgi:hypothetical protein
MGFVLWVLRWITGARHSGPALRLLGSTMHEWKYTLCSVVGSLGYCPLHLAAYREHSVWVNRCDPTCCQIPVTGEGSKGVCEAENAQHIGQYNIPSALGGMSMYPHNVSHVPIWS